MTLVGLLKKSERFARDNSPTILTALGVSGTLTTAYLAGKASFEAADWIRRGEINGTLPEARGYKHERLKARTKHVWRLYIPATLSAGTTVACIVFASRASARRTAALTAAYSLSERAFEEYREKVTEKLGERKEKAVRDELAQNRVGAFPPGSVILGTGTVLCCELHTMRYFNGDMETLRKAQNDTNAQLIREDDARLSDFYDRVGLGHTDVSSNFGWSSDKMLELDFSTALADDGRPCLTFGYNYIKPR